MLISYKRGQGSIISRVKIRDSSVSTGAGLTGLTFSSSGLRISTIADNEATATTYTAAGSTIETITTLGTYAAPTATKCRFKEVDATSHKGIYELQIADARFAVSSAKSLIVSISGATNAAECDVAIPLVDVDPYDSVRAGLTALPNAAAGASGGLLISGSNSGTTTLGALTVSGATTLTGAVTASNASNSVNLGTDSIGSTQIAASAVTEIQSGLSTLTQAQVTGGSYALNSASFAWNAALDFSSTQKTSLNAATPAVTISAGGITNASLAADTGLKPIRSGTCQGTGNDTTHVKLDSGASSTDEFYLSQLLYFTGGTGAGQCRTILDYNGTTKICIVGTDPNLEQPLAVAADGSTTFAILPAGVTTSAGSFAAEINSQYPWLASTNGSATMLKVDVGDYETGKVPLQPTVAGRTLDVSATGEAGVDWSNVGGQSTSVNLSGTTVNLANTVTNLTNLPTMPTDWLTSTGLAASAVSEIQSGLSTLTQAQVTGGSYALNSASFAWNAALDFSSTQKTSLNAATPVVTLATSQPNYAPAKAGDAMALTSGERNSVADALLDRADAIETGVTLRQAMRAIAADAAGLISGAGTGTEVFKGIGQTSGGTTRKTATVDSSGNITGWSLNL